MHMVKIGESQKRQLNKTHVNLSKIGECINFAERGAICKFCENTFIHSFHFSSPLLPRSALDTARTLSWSFTPKRHRQLRVKDLPKVPTWWPQRDSNPRPFCRKGFDSTNAPARPTIGGIYKFCGYCGEICNMHHWLRGWTYLSVCLSLSHTQHNTTHTTLSIREIASEETCLQLTNHHYHATDRSASKL